MIGCWDPGSAVPLHRTRRSPGARSFCFRRATDWSWARCQPTRRLGREVPVSLGSVDRTGRRRFRICGAPVRYLGSTATCMRGEPPVAQSGWRRRSGPRRWRGRAHGGAPARGPGSRRRRRPPWRRCGRDTRRRTGRTGSQPLSAASRRGRAQRRMRSHHGADVHRVIGLEPHALKGAPLLQPTKIGQRRKDAIGGRGNLVAELDRAHRCPTLPCHGSSERRDLLSHLLCRGKTCSPLRLFELSPQPNPRGVHHRI